jgi:hypothetical protein
LARFKLISRPVSHHRFRDASAAGSTPADGHSDQYSYAYGDRKCNEGTIFSLSGNSLQRIAANSGTDFGGLITNSGDLVDPKALAAEAIQYFMQDGPDCIGDLISSRRGSSRRAPASALSNSAELLFNGAQVARDGGDARVKFP